MTDREAMQIALEALEDVFGKNKVDVGAITALRAQLEQPEQEPVAYINPTKNNVSTDPVHRHNKDCQPLYTYPPQRKPLTNDEIALIYMSHTDQPLKAYWEFARAIEQAHGIGEKP